MVLHEFDQLHAEFTTGYRIDVETTGEDGQPVTRQRLVPGLLDQLDRATAPGGTGPAVGGGSGLGSREPVRLSAVNLLDEIRRALAWWATTYAGRAGASAAGSLHELSTVAYAMDRHSMTLLIGDLDAWRTRARWILGWEAPPFAPHLPCPECASVATLRLWAEEHYAACVVCGAWWDKENLGRLRDQIRLTRDLTHAR